MPNAGDSSSQIHRLTDFFQISAQFRVVKRTRFFGGFQEKTLMFDEAAKEAIDAICRKKGYTQSWASKKTEDGFFTMTKIPVVILVELMFKLPKQSETVAQSLAGAYSICMAPDTRTCMNVIVERRLINNTKYKLHKFSLYYPNNASMYSKYGTNWPLVEGYAFRTAVFNGQLGENRVHLQNLETNEQLQSFGLVIDSVEDCAYVNHIDGESQDEKIKRIRTIVNTMLNVFKPNLSLSYPPDGDRTALFDEWELFMSVLSPAATATTQPSEIRI